MSKILASWSAMRKYLENEMFAILDRRVGKRTLSQLVNHTLAPVWLNQFLDLRMKEDEKYEISEF